MHFKRHNSKNSTANIFKMLDLQKKSVKEF